MAIISQVRLFSARLNKLSESGTKLICSALTRTWCSTEQKELDEDNVVAVDMTRFGSAQQEDPRDVNVNRHVRSTGAYRRLYEAVYRRSLENPEDFWAEKAEDIHWFRRWDKVLDDSNSPFTKWFVGGELNTCYNCVDRHVERGFGNQVAVIHDSPVTNSIKKITYSELLTEVSKFAWVLASRGVRKGDRVLIYMPMIPQAIVAMLACARLGAMHSLVFGGFASKELATRFNHAEV